MAGTASFSFNNLTSSFHKHASRFTPLTRIPTRLKIYNPIKWFSQHRPPTYPLQCDVLKFPFAIAIQLEIKKEQKQVRLNGEKSGK